MLAAISACDDYRELARILNAANRRRSQVQRPQLTAAQVKAGFKVGETVEIFDLQQKDLNGALGKITAVKVTKITVNIPGFGLINIPADCAVVVEGEPPEVGPATVFKRGDRIRVKGGKIDGSDGVVVGLKGARYSVFIKGRGSYNIPGEMMEKLPALTPNPNLLVMFKSEGGGRDPFGPVTIVDTTKADPKALRGLDEKVEGIEDLSWQERSVAQAIAISLGARFEAT